MERLLDMVEITFSTLASLGKLTWPLVLLFDMPKFGLQKEFEELAVDLIDGEMNVRSICVPKRRK
jgi:hypothetical protein